MFKERLRHTTKELLYWIGMFSISILFIIIVIGIPTYFMTTYEKAEVILFYAWLIVVSCLALYILYLVGKKVCRFIHWLFIEPFRKKKIGGESCK